MIIVILLLFLRIILIKLEYNEKKLTLLAFVLFNLLEPIALNFN